MRWTRRPEPPFGICSELEQRVTKDALLARLLAQRGIEGFDEAKAFFRPTMDAFHNPYKMLGMERAVERIQQAYQRKERVLIYGDYDVDGTTAVALVSTFLEPKLDLEAYIPDRYKEGYGLSFQGINYAAEHHFSLIIALDCGIKAFDTIAHARTHGIDVIVCDHHRPGPTLPKAHTVLNPKQSGCPYPYKELSGCGVGYKLCEALCEHWGLLPSKVLHPMLDLCAVSVAADIVPVTGENRLFAHFGLELIRQGKSRPAFQAMLEKAGKNSAGLTLTDVAFSIAPRINAAGRMESGLSAVHFLRSTAQDETVVWADRIEDFNLDRRKTQETTAAEALSMLDPERYPYSNVLYAPHWHKGVVGIVASKVVEARYRPTLVLTKSGDKIAGSARSVKGFDIYDAIGHCEKYVLQFGGHMYAAGLTLHEEQLPGFKRAFEEYCRTHLKPQMLEPELVYDHEATLSELNHAKFYNVLRQLEPHGPHNDKPLFRVRDLVALPTSRAVGKDASHLKIDLKHSWGGPTMSGIAFGLGHMEEQVKSGVPFEVVASLELNEFRGEKSLQLMISDLQIQPSPSHA